MLEALFRTSTASFTALMILNGDSPGQESLTHEYFIAPSVPPPPPTAMIALPSASSFRVNIEFAIFNGCISKGLTASGPSRILLVF